MHNRWVQSKSISDDENEFFPSGRSPTALAAVSQLHGPHLSSILEGCRENVNGGWDVNVHMDSVSGRSQLLVVSFNFQAAVPCTFMPKGIPTSNQCILVFTWVWVLVMFMKCRNSLARLELFSVASHIGLQKALVTSGVTVRGKKKHLPAVPSILHEFTLFPPTSGIAWKLATFTWTGSTLRQLFFLRYQRFGSSLQDLVLSV